MKDKEGTNFTSYIAPPIEIMLVDGRKIFMPQRMTNEAAGMDCRVRKIEKYPDGLVVCYLGFKTTIPNGYFADIRPRSSIRSKGWVLVNSPGTIDSDFRGEWQASFRPLPILNDAGQWVTTPPEFPYKEDERCCQIIIRKEERQQWLEVEFLERTERKDEGFGTTGNK